MKEKKKLCQYIAFILISCIMFLAGSEAMKVTELTAVCNVKGLYQEEENSLDAVVIGASEAYTSYAPTLAWKEFGYTSYAYATPGAGGSLYKTMLAEVLRTQKPKVVAFEINGFIHGDNYNYNEARVRNVIDNMKWSRNWVNAIETIVPEEDRMSFYLPIMAYHGNWSQPLTMLKNASVKAAISLSGRSYMKGVSTTSAIRSYQGQEKMGRINYTEANRKLLQELMDYCKSQGIEHVLFFRAPHVKLPDNPKELRKIRNDVKSYGYDWIDFNRDLKGLGIDTGTDFYNKEHLNLYGMEKFTHIMGELLTTEYGLEGIHTQAQADKWKLCADKTDEKLAECRQDLENGIRRVYSEASFYWQPPEVEEEMEE